MVSTGAAYSGMAASFRLGMVVGPYFTGADSRTSGWYNFTDNQENYSTISGLVRNVL